MNTTRRQSIENILIERRKISKFMAPVPAGSTVNNPLIIDFDDFVN